jgi:hypothetical protein
MVANEIQFKFSLFIVVKNNRIWGNFHPFDFTPKSHLRRIISYSNDTLDFFQNLFQNHPV